MAVGAIVVSTIKGIEGIDLKSKNPPFVTDNIKKIRHIITTVISKNKDLKKAKNAQAIKEMQIIVKQYPQLAQSHYNLALVLAEERRYVEAAQEFEAAIRLPGCPPEDTRPGSGGARGLPRRRTGRASGERNRTCLEHGFSEAVIRTVDLSMNP